MKALWQKLVALLKEWWAILVALFTAGTVYVRSAGPEFPQTADAWVSLLISLLITLLGFLAKKNGR